MLDTRYPHQVSSYRVATADPPQDGILLSHPARQHALHVDAAGAVVWAICNGQRTVADVAQILADAYPESAGDIKQHVLDTLLALTEFGAIEWT